MEVANGARRRPTCARCCTISSALERQFLGAALEMRRPNYISGSAKRLRFNTHTNFLRQAISKRLLAGDG